MRVIAGSARGRKLKTLEGMDVRPTTDKVKEAIFSAIQFDLPDAAVLDLFAGSGQMGIEALSRGAASVVFVDRSARSLQVTRENLESVQNRHSCTRQRHSRFCSPLPCSLTLPFWTRRIERACMKSCCRCWQNIWRIMALSSANTKPVWKCPSL